MSSIKENFPIIGTSVQKILDDLKRIVDHKNLKTNDTFKINWKKKTIIYNDNDFLFFKQCKMDFTSKTSSWRYRIEIWLLFDIIKYKEKDDIYEFTIKDLSILNNHVLNESWFNKNEKRIINKNNKYTKYFTSFLLSLFFEKYKKENTYKKKVFYDELKSSFSFTNKTLLNREKKLSNDWSSFQKRLSKDAKLYLLNLFKKEYLIDDMKYFMIMDELWMDPMNCRIKTTKNNSFSKNHTNFNILNIRTLEDLLKIEDTIFIPQFQREYVWKKWIISVFAQDIVKLLNGKKSKLFLGTLIFTRDKNKKNRFSLVDGQQRYLTLLIILRVLFHFLVKENITIPKKWYEFLKSRELKIDGMDYIKKFLKYISLDVDKENDNINISKQTKEALVTIYEVFYEAYKANRLFHDKENNDYFSILGEKIKIYGFIYDNIEHLQDSVDIFVTQNTSSQIVDTYTLIMAFLMSKLKPKEVTYDNLTRINESMDEYKPFYNYLGDKVFLKHFYYYLCIKNDSNIKQIKKEKDESNMSLENYKFFKEYIYRELYRKIGSKQPYYSFETIMSFVNEIKKFYWSYHGLKKWKNLKTNNEYLKKWKKIYDLLLCLNTITPLFPIIIYLTHYYEDALKDYNKGSKEQLTNLRWLLWSLLKIYLRIYSYGESLQNIVIDYKDAFKDEYFYSPKDFWEKLKSISDEEPIEIQQRLEENLQSSKTDKLKIIIHIILELYLRSIEDNSLISVDEAFYTPIDPNTKRERFIEFYQDKKDFQLEHIIPKNRDKLKNGKIRDIDFKEIEGTFKDYYNRIGNTTLLHSSINVYLKNEVYNKKQSLFQKKAKRFELLKINDDVKIQFATKDYLIKGPYNMALWETKKAKIKIVPSEKDLKERHNAIINFVMDLIEK